MLCSACATSALRCFLTGTTGLRVQNVHLFRINSSLLPKQPAHTSRISTLRPSHVSGLHTTLSLGEGPRRRKELFNRDRNGSMTGSKDPTRIHENSGGAAHTATAPVALLLREDSMKTERSLDPPSLPENVESCDQDWFEGMVKGQGQCGNETSDWPKDSIREKNPRFPKPAGHNRKARLRDYSSRTLEGSKGAMGSSQSTKASAGFRTGTRNYKDQRELWGTQKSALVEKFGPTGWLPRKRLSPDTLEGIRALHAHYPDKFTTPILADQFKVSPEAIRRILKSKWRPKDEEEERRRRRWEKRGENIWNQMVEMGIKPPRKWREMGVGKSREKKPARSEQLESQIKSKSKVTLGLLGQPTTNLYTIPANGHKIGSPVPLADRIL